MTSSIKRTLFSLFLCFTLMMGIIPFASAATKDISVLLDGKKVSFGVSPQVVNGSTMVPYRALAEAVGAKVEWDGKSKATITKGDSKVELTIGQKTASVNGKSISFDVAPFTQDGSTLVPLRFVGESLGLWVNWNQATSTASLETTKTIKHSMGTTKLEKKPERVVVLYNGMVDISVLLGVKPVGAVESFVEQPFYKYLRDEMEGVKVLGDENQPNLEAIVSLKPDLIIGSKMRHEKIYDQLKSIAPTLMSEDTYNWQENLQMAATALNKEAIANKFLADWDKQVANFKSKMGNRAKETEISIIRFNPDGSARAYLTGFAYNIMMDLGFSFPEAQTKTEKEIVTIKTKEQIPVFDADYIFDFTTDWDGDGGVYKHQKDWVENPLWKNMKAVKSNKYYKVNVVTWNMSGGPMAAKKMLDDLYLFFDLE